ncbi:caffeic acid 3-O-methyltransferase-like [Primulina eburnea]|uniref:caffeic acid 3-O-methyltransferase-like n=1 Tax=Primulina eburnea TaxID=1245227 RepID=UPI003C6CA1BF
MEKQVRDIYYKHGKDEDDEAFVECLVACGSHILQSVLMASIQLDLFDIIGKSGDGAHVSAFEIASQLQARNVEGAVGVLDSMLRVLVTQSFLTCSTIDHASTTELRYGLAPKGKFFVSDERGVSLAQFYALASQRESSNPSIGLKDAVLQGGFLLENAQTFFELLASNPQSNKIFNDAMGCVSTPTMKQILKVYNGFEGLHTIVDVGGGNGATLDMIISMHSSISGINLDSPEVIRTAPNSKGVKHVGGDMFVEVPKGDAIILKSVLHDWVAERCVKLLKNCYKALPKKGKVIVIESILPDQIPQTDVYSRYVSLLNVFMLSMNGKERTKGEYEAMATQAGFAEFKVVCRAYGSWVMELVKL